MKCLLLIWRSSAAVLRGCAAWTRDSIAHLSSLLLGIKERCGLKWGLCDGLQAPWSFPGPGTFRVTSEIPPPPGEGKEGIMFA